MALKKWFAGIRYLVLLIAIALIASPLYHFGNEKIYKWKSKQIWEKWETMGDSLDFVPAGWLTIPTVNVNSLVVHDATKENLDRFPSFIQLQENGLQMIMAHRDIHFFPLKDCEVGNSLQFETKLDGILNYEIVDIEIIDKTLAEKKLIEKRNEKWMVLLTCYPFSYIGSAPQRYLMWCKKKNSINASINTFHVELIKKG